MEKYNIAEDQKNPRKKHERMERPVCSASQFQDIYTKQVRDWRVATSRFILEEETNSAGEKIMSKFYIFTGKISRKLDPSSAFWIFVSEVKMTRMGFGNQLQYYSITFSVSLSLSLSLSP